MSHEKQILIINGHSSDNAGDAALTEETIHQLQQTFPGCRITLAIDDPASHQGEGRVIGSILHWCKRKSDRGYSVWDLAGLFRILPGSLLSVAIFTLFGRRAFPLLTPNQRESVEAYFDADIVVSKPGGYLYSSSGIGIPFMLILYQIALALLTNKPHYMLPQSIGPITQAWQKILVRLALNHSRLTMVREPISMNELTQIKVDSKRYVQVFDMAFSYEAETSPKARQWLQEHGVHMDDTRVLLGITVLNWNAQNSRFNAQANYEAAMCNALRRFIDTHNVKLVFLPQVIGPTIEQDDRLVAKRVVAQINRSDSIAVIDTQASAAMMKAIFGQMNLMLGTRMHSNIFALSLGVPTLAIGYLHKTQGIMQMLGLESWVIDIQEINATVLLEKLNRLWEEQSSLKVTIQKVISTARQSAAGATTKIQQDMKETEMETRHG